MIKDYIKDILKCWEAMRINKSLSNKVCVFRCKGGAPGLFSYVIQVLGFVRYAHKNNMRPVIDLKSFENTYLAKESVGKLNAWDYYFQQPDNITLEEVPLGNSNIFDTTDRSTEGLLKMPWWDWACLNEGSAANKMWRAYAHRYLRLSPNAQENLDRIYNKLVQKGDKVLGIQCRGTDYTRHKPKAHPVQPSPEMVMEKAEQLIKERGYNKIFLATEDGIVFNKFKERFGDMIIASDEHHVEYDGDAWVNTILPSGQQEKFNHGMDYLMSMMMLTRCDAFVAGKTSGSVGVMLLSKGFEYSYFFELGYYE